MPTPTRSRREERRRERARRQRFLAGACVTLVLLGFALVRFSRVDPIRTGASEPATTRAVLTLTTEPADASEVDTGSVYRYSVIPGGAATAAQLERAMAADPVIRAHYANFNLARLRVVRLTAARVAHVSYRIDNSVFWTRRALLLDAGETLLTDGEHYARTRCGNRLAPAPALMSPLEPPAAAFNTPVAARVELSPGVAGP